MFHRWIENEIAKIDLKNYIDSECEVNPEKDHLLGEMSDDLKKLLTLWRRVSRKNQELAKKGIEITDQLLRDLRTIKSDDEGLRKIQGMLNDMLKQQAVAEEREEALRRVFWISVSDEFPAAEGHDLAVCKGFKVVWYEEKKKEAPKLIGFVLAS